MSEAGPGYRRILAPVDFSPSSAHALTYALALGSAFGSVVDALHVWRTNTQTPVHVARERAREELRAFASGIGPRGAVVLRRRTDYGDPFLTILRIAQLSSYDLLVTVAPQAGRDGPEHLGSSLMLTARLPVLLVFCPWLERRKEPDLKRHVRRMLLPAAFGGRSERALLRALELASAFDARLEVLFVDDPRADGDQQRFRARLAHCDAALRERVEPHETKADLASALEGRAREGGYELCVLAGRATELHRRATDPLLERVLHAQTCPTLCERYDEPPS